MTAPDRDSMPPDDGETRPTLRKIDEHRAAKPWENERDRAVLTLCFTEWDGLPEPKPDLPTWIAGAATALLLIRQVSS